MKLRPVPAWRSEDIAIDVRAYARRAGRTGRRGSWPKSDEVTANDIVLLFDTETTIDPAQRLRVLFYQLRVGGRLDEEGAAYDPAALTLRDIDTLHVYCRNRKLPEPMPIEVWREQVLLAKAYDCGGEIVGFNLPFDLARIAIDAAPARTTKTRRKMHKGFSLKISDDPARPRIQVKHLGARSALMEFTAERRQRTSRPDRQKGQFLPPSRGFFTDVSTLGVALTSQKHRLESLCVALGAETRKAAVERHGGPLTPKYLNYARTDVQVTWECFEILRDRLSSYDLDLETGKVLSEASLGKAMLKKLGIRSWLDLNPDVSSALIANIMCAYFGGRTEVRWRKVVKEVFHTDFTSMYPTVCVLQGLWRFIIARGFETSDATADTRLFLNRVTSADLQDPATWRRLTTLVRVQADNTLLPVRAPYAGDNNSTIGLNYLSCETPLWYTLADCIASKILSGSAPVVLEAIRFEPGPVQGQLRPMRLLGKHRFEPVKEDLFQRLIQLRIEEKRRASSLEGEDQARAEEMIQFLKIVANSAYGICAQSNVSEEGAPVDVEVFGPDGLAFTMPSRKVEEPGPFFNPLVATMITGGARLMLALAEHRAETEGLDWVFCDTDSLALARPDGMDAQAFDAAAWRVIQWFTPLNPYEAGKSILNAEKANFAADGSRLPLHCLAISSKRYALFNISPDGTPIIRKGSAHGLGHLRAPYKDADAKAAERIDMPDWHRDLWLHLAEAALAGKLHSVRYDWHKSLRQPAIGQYKASNADLWRWYDPLNVGRPYAEQIKPFGFLHALFARAGTGDIHPVAPFDKTIASSVRKAFDRLTGEHVPSAKLKTYAEALSIYHLSRESKFRNGEAFDLGRTERRHIRAAGVSLIGKEADQFEEVAALGKTEEVAIRYEPSATSAGDLMAEIAAAAERHGQSAVAAAIGSSRSTVAKIAAGRNSVVRVAPARVRAGLAGLGRASATKQEAYGLEAVAILQAIEAHGGLRAAARALGKDPSNLARFLRR